MADVTPSTAFLGGSCVLTWGANTYHGIQNYGWSGSVEEQVIKFSTSSGTGTSRLGGDETDADDSFTFDIVCDAGGAASTVDALKRGTTETTFEVHPEGDAAGNLEFIGEAGLVSQSDMAGGVDGAGILSVTIGVNGTLTIQDAT